MNRQVSVGASESTRDQATRERRYWPIALGLVVAVFLVLSVAFLLDKQFRPTVGVEPLAGVVPEASGNAGGSPAQTDIGAGTLPWPRVGRTALEREVEDAYARYWEIRTQAYLTLNPSRLPEVMGGNGLSAEEKMLRDLQYQGRAAKLNYQHRVTLRQVGTDQATVYDEHVNHSVFVDLSTNQELPTNTSPEIERVSYELRKINGNWKVVDGVLHG